MGYGEEEVLSVRGNRKALNANYTGTGDLVAGAA